MIAPFLHQILIEAHAGASFMGDIAIDDLSLSTSPCTTVDALCTFDKDTCGYTDDKSSSMQFQWTRASKATSSHNTGPTNDHTQQSSSGFYMYTEASSQKEGDKARMVSPVYPKKSARCLSFWYHMFGQTMGTLRVFLKVNGTLQIKPIWSESGNKGNVWRVGRATMKSPYTDYQVSLNTKYKYC